MPDYVIEFTYRRHGIREAGSTQATTKAAIPNLATAQAYMTADVQAALEQSIGDTVTGLTITDVHLA